MLFPADLPCILFYRVGCTCRVALPRTPVEFVSSSGKTTASQVCPQIPYGADAWQLAADIKWRPMSELPPEWMPFLNRTRGTEMDPRSSPKLTAKDAIVE